MGKNSVRKEQILESAAKLFRKKGFKATSMRMIASNLGLEAASLYNHIHSKQKILEELLLGMGGRFMEGMNEVEDSKKNPLEKLDLLIGLHVKLTLSYPEQISLITGDWVHLEEPALTQYKTLRNAYELKFKTIITDGMNEGLIENIDIEMALFSILSSLHWLYSWYARHPEMKGSDIEREIKKCLISGLKKREENP